MPKKKTILQITGKLKFLCSPNRHHTGSKKTCKLGDGKQTRDEFDEKKFGSKTDNSFVLLFSNLDLT